MVLEISAMTHAEAVVTGPNAAMIEKCSIRFRENGNWRAMDECQSFFAPPQTAGGLYIDPVSRTAIAAARCLKTSIPPASPESIGCILSSHYSNAYSIASFESARLRGKRSRPLLFAHSGWNVPTALLAAEIGCRGFTSTLSGDKSATELLSYADSILNSGRAEGLLIGCVDLNLARQTDTPDLVIQTTCTLCVVKLTVHDSAPSTITQDEFLEATEWQ